MESKFEVADVKIMKFKNSKKNQRTGTQFPLIALMSQIH